jgi:phosphoribosylglycinamide formyltransferase-1
MTEPPENTGEFIGDPITPVAGTADARAMATGAPGLPARFTWRGREFQVAQVLRTWKELGRCTHGSPERYVRKHWFAIRTTSGHQMQIYCDRQPRRGKSPKARWWLFTVLEP